MSPEDPLDYVWKPIFDAGWKMAPGAFLAAIFDYHYLEIDHPLGWLAFLLTGGVASLALLSGVAYALKRRE